MVLRNDAQSVSDRFHSRYKADPSDAPICAAALLTFLQVTFRDKHGAQELQRLRDRVFTSLNAEAPPASAAQEHFNLLRELVRFGGRRVRIMNGMKAMARAHAERDVRQLRKLKALFAAARREGLLPAGFDYRAAGEAWRRAHAAAAGGSGGDNRHQQSEEEQHGELQRNQQHEPQHGEQHRPQDERAGQGEPSARPETAGRQHCATADVEMVERGDDTGVPPWRPLDGGDGGDADEDMVAEPQEEEQRAEEGGREDDSGEGGGSGCTLRELLDDLEVLVEDGDEGDDDSSGGVPQQHSGDEEDEEEEEEFAI